MTSTATAQRRREGHQETRAWPMRVKRAPHPGGHGVGPTPACDATDSPLPCWHAGCVVSQFYILIVIGMLSVLPRAPAVAIFWLLARVTKASTAGPRN